MITQAYISKSLAGLDFKKVYGLKSWKVRRNYYEPLIVFGMYREEDFEVTARHEGDTVIVWQGMDARNVNPNWILAWGFHELTHKIKHYAISHWGQRSLKRQGIKSTLLPISATKPKIHVVPRGDSIYTYSSDADKKNGRYYGDHYLDEIKERTGLNIIRATIDTYNKKDLKEIYSQCFINLRLTRYDGCPNTNLEMGLMGRRSIFNGKIPHSIKWKGVDDICSSIMREYEARPEDNTQIAKDIYNYINIGKSFLEI